MKSGGKVLVKLSLAGNEWWSR